MTKSRTSPSLATATCSSRHPITKATTHLFCNSDFLVQKNAATDEALDYKGHGIVVNGDLITISQVAAYANELKDGNVPWWSGDNTNINGYYFTLPSSGGNYCKSSNLDLTATLSALRQDKSGEEPRAYDRASAAITAGTSLEKAVPKSTTLLHEAFHVGFWDQLYSGKRRVLVNAKTGRANPENYDFFVATMHHLFGMTTMWDFTDGPDKTKTVPT
ncbi:hypothetical protein B0T22DRAFT_513370 [Podospora appendiculata]|uniref:Uncharacterized protein n=1 Tax=Podospora appendiculata TaxID=314037 RepID=A0AAE1CD35_9PEZI|nr:hypothetical protein B0T22DRAFT_513370 [Podospora appendiculata]